MVVEVVWRAFGYEEVLASDHNLNKQKILWKKKKEKQFSNLTKYRMIIIQTILHMVVPLGRAFWAMHVICRAQWQKCGMANLE